MAFFLPLIGLAAKAVLPSQLNTDFEPKKLSFVRVLLSGNQDSIKGEVQSKIFQFLKQKNSFVPISELKIFSKNPSSVCKTLEAKA